MWIALEDWQLHQLQRLARHEPGKAEAALNALWSACPTLLEDLAIAAVDQEMLTVDQCAELISCSVEAVEERLVEYRRSEPRVSVVETNAENGKVAHLSESKITVWEIVREFRKIGSVAELRRSFPGLHESDLASALRYAEANPGEIEGQIRHYEELRDRKRAEYPMFS